jgi:formate dehydrogenase subunit beta
MTVESILGVKNGDTLGTVRGFLKTLLEQNVVDAMLVPLEVPSADRVTPTLVKEALQLDTANPLAPVMRLNAAAMLVRMQKENQTQRVGAVLRPCELRAVIELAKFDRITLDRLTLIGIDCMGTYEPEAYAQIARSSMRAQSPTDEMLRWTRQGPIAPYRLRNACQMCEYFSMENADVAIGLIGLNVRERLLVEACEEIAEKLNLRSGSANGRAKAIARLAAIRKSRREQAMANAAQLLKDVPSLLGIIALCTACGECVNVCPFCGTDAFAPQAAREPHADHLRDWPSDEGRTMREREVGPFGDLIKWGRRAASCVSCGMCESACPNHVPLTAIQAVLGHALQQQYDYVPGRSVEEKLPWATA